MVYLTDTRTRTRPAPFKRTVAARKRQAALAREAPRPRRAWQLVVMQDGEPAYWNRQRHVPAGRPRPALEMIELVLLPRFAGRFRRGDVMRYYPYR